MNFYIGKNALSTLVNEIKDLINTRATSNHKHSTSDITSGSLSVARGGTGGASVMEARENLGSINIVLSDTEPNDQNNGDFWFKEI